MTKVIDSAFIVDNLSTSSCINDSGKVVKFFSVSMQDRA